MSELTQRTIEVCGEPIKFFGYAGDPYFDSLEGTVAPNAFFAELLLTVRPAPTIVDVGANLGITSMMASRLRKDGIVFAIEAAPHATEALRRTFDANTFQGAPPDLTEVALGSAAGKAYFHEAQFLAGSHLCVDGGIDRTDMIEVRTMTLDDFVFSKRIVNLDFVKVDVEGFEFDVLLGAQKTVERDNPLFVIEFNSYAITACRNASPWALVQFVLERFGAFCYRRPGQEITIVRTEQQGKDFLYSNMHIGCVDDIAFGGSFIDSL